MAVSRIEILQAAFSRYSFPLKIDLSFSEANPHGLYLGPEEIKG